MPNINLRLTEEEHAELREWAREGRRSIQREIIWRLFTVEGNQATKVGPVGITMPPDPRGRAVLSRQGVTVPLPDDHFKPDPKGGK